MTEYEVVIGLEVHAELNTKSKIYCSCLNRFGLQPNTAVCPVCMGLPGALPVLNKKAVEYAARMGLALNCRINTLSRQDRKNYFYPDLPKAYQISQADVPLCENGFADVLVNGSVKRIRINRIHIEEDAGKLLHDDVYEGSLVDLNRCGVPLIEIVSEPDMRSSAEAKAFLDNIKMTLQYLCISDCRMQEGSIRCDVNVSVRKKGEAAFGTRCEMKNVNSFSAAVRGIEYEANRQIALIEAGGTVEQETRRWDDAKGKSIVMRTKENAQDYRYFPEPDLSLIEIEEDTLDELKRSIPELPTEKILRYMNDFGFTEIEAVLIAEDKERAAFLDACVSEHGSSPGSICNWLLTDIAKFQNDTGRSLGETYLTPIQLSELVSMTEKGVISNTAGKKVLAVMLQSGGDPEEITERLGLRQNSDPDSLIRLVKEVIASNEKPVADYRNGKKNALGYIVGQCMKRSGGTANPSMARELVAKSLE